MSEVAYYFASELNRNLSVPVAFIQSAYSGTAINAWMSKEALEADPAGQAVIARWDGSLGAHAPSAVYNSMINPIFPYSIGGIIWYQGETDVIRPDEYRSLFRSLIRSWRASFAQGDIPFYYVQLPGYNTSNGDWPGLREAQAEGLAEPNTGMVVTIDIGDPTQIHPGDKDEVGRRLALLALARTYGFKGIVDSGPFLDRVSFNSNGTVRAFFSDMAGGLTGAPLTGFQLAGVDQVFHPAIAEIDGSTNTVLLSSGSVPSPSSVRYAWSNPVWDHSLANSAGLPATPFRMSSVSSESFVEAEEIAQATSSDSLAPFYDRLASGGTAEFLGANQVNDYAAYIVPTQANTYSIKVGYKRYSSRGQYRLMIDGVSQGMPQDQYGSTPGWFEADLGTKTFGTSGTSEFRFTVTGKNASSPAYFLTFDYIKLIPLATALLEAEEIAQATSSDSLAIFHDRLASGDTAEFLGANQVNDYAAYIVPTQAGTYSIKVGYKKYSSRGQYRLTVDGVSQGMPQDQYGSTPGWFEADLGTKTFGTSGTSEFRFTVTGKNASSPAYSLTFDYFKLTPISGSP